MKFQCITAVEYQLLLQYFILSCEETQKLFVHCKFSSISLIMPKLYNRIISQL